MKHLPLLVAVLTIGTLLPPFPLYAADFGQLQSEVQRQLGRLSEPRTADTLTTHLLEMYLWSKDSFEIPQWPELWPQAERWPQHWEPWLTSKRAEQQAKAHQLQAAYALLLHDYEGAQEALSLQAKGFYAELIQALLGEQSPDQPGVWRIALEPVRKLAKRYPSQAIAQLVLAEACLERIEQPDSQQALLREAQAAVQKALRLDSKQLYARYQQGQILYLQGKKESALAHFESQVALHDPLAAEAVGNFYVWMQQPETAWRFLNGPARKSPSGCVCIKKWNSWRHCVANRWTLFVSIWMAWRVSPSLRSCICAWAFFTPSSAKMRCIRPFRPFFPCAAMSPL